MAMPPTFCLRVTNLLVLLVNLADTKLFDYPKYELTHKSFCMIMKDPTKFRKTLLEYPIEQIDIEKLEIIE